MPKVVALSRPASPEVGYLARYFTRLHFPMTRPPANMLMYQRTDGRRQMRMIADPRFGLPYGTDVVVLYGLCTRGRETARRLGKKWDGKISFSSTAEMLRYFGEPPTQHYYHRRMDSILRIWGTRVVFEDTIRRASDSKAEQKHFSRTEFLTDVTAWFQLNEPQIGSSLENTMQFSSPMMEWVRQAPMFDDNKIFAVKQSVGLLQLYLLLRDRCSHSSLRYGNSDQTGWIPVHGPMALESQLGWLRQPEPREVRRLINEWLDGIRETIWPECPGELHKGNDGIWRLLVRFCAKT